MVKKGLMIALVFLWWGVFVVAASAQELPGKIDPPACAECCERAVVSPGISADEVMRIKYYIKYTKFASDYRSDGEFLLIDKRGFKRTRGFERYRTLLYRTTEEVDYKDLVVITDPQQLKGLAILTWNYLDPSRYQDIWLWLPSLRKIRRVSQSEADDSALGSDWTTEELSTRRWEDETYQMIGEKKFPGFKSDYNGNTYYKDVECYVVEAKPKREEWYYSKRMIWIDKRHGSNIHDEVYDPVGRKFKVFLKEYALWENGCVPQTHLEAYNLQTGHSTINEIRNIRFNSKIPDRFFTEKNLMRTKW